MSQRSPHWPAVREKFLKTHPKCAACGRTDHLQVHHILPFHLHPDRELDPTNLITLCERPGHDCHFVFGHFHDWYRYNPEVVAMTAAYYSKELSAP